MKKLILAIILLLVPAISNAADLTSDTCPGTGCITIPIGSESAAAIQLSGTFSGTVTFQGTTDGTNYVSIAAKASTQTTATTLVTTSTAAGLFTADVRGLKNLRIACTTYSSGTIVVFVKVVRP